MRPPEEKVLSTIIGALLVSLCLASTAWAASGQISFDIAPRYKIGLNTTDVAYADIDSDGFMDLAAVNGGQGNPSPTMTIRFGEAGGTFAPPLVLPTLTIGQSIAAGDLNGDGQPDLVIASWYHNRIAVFLNLGDRQFAAPWFSAPPDPPYGGNPNTSVGEFFGVAIADFDGDGNNDVVALQDQINQRIRFFHFSGQGLLTVFATLDQLEAGTSYERVMEVGDVNGDSRPDLVFAGGGPFGDRNISFVLGQAPGGTLSLTYGFAVTDKTVGVDIADLDSDGDRDLAVAFLDTTTPTRHSVQVFRNNGGMTFSPQPKMFLEYPFPPSDVTTDDLNNDGKQDIAALIGSVESSGLMVMLMYGDDNGAFTNGGFYGTSMSSSIYSADIDLDGRIDVLTASTFLDQTNYEEDGNSVSVLFNDSEIGFRAPLSTLWGPNFIASGDLNNDGFSDLVSSWATSFNSTSGVDVLLNDRNRGLIPEVHHPSPASLKGMKTGDFNGDTLWDAISIHEDNARVLAFYAGNGTGALAVPVLTQFTNGLTGATIGDFNSDGRDDVFVIDDTGSGYSMLGNANGTFTAAPGSPIDFPSGVSPAPNIGDFNRDGRLDLVISINMTAAVWFGDGTGRFEQSGGTTPAMSLTVAGDWNGDGNLDLAGMIEDGIAGALGDGLGGFGPTFYRPIEGTYSIGLTSSTVSADFDRDGSDEVALLMADNLNGNVIIMQFDEAVGSPVWKTPIFYGIGPAYRTYGGMLVAEDFNADGKPDLAYLGTNARGVVYNTTEISTRAPFDFDGDGKTDVAIFRPAPTGGEWWWQRSEDNQVVAATFGLSTDVIAPGDMTGDGRMDITVWRPSNGWWYVLRSEDFSFYGFPFGTAGDVPVTADYDGDGRDDPAVFRESGGQWFVTRSIDGQVETRQFGQAGDVPVAADYDGDGKADFAILRRDGPSGAEWWITKGTGGSTAFIFGASTDIAAPGDYTGDGMADIAVFRPSNGYWFVLRSEDLSFFSFPFGTDGDQPISGDYDGDGRIDPAVFRPSTNTWYIDGSTSGMQIQNFGLAGDKPVPSAFVR